MQPCFKTIYIGLKAPTATTYTAKRRSLYFQMIESKKLVAHAILKMLAVVLDLTVGTPYTSAQKFEWFS